MALVYFSGHGGIENGYQILCPIETRGPLTGAYTSKPIYVDKHIVNVLRPGEEAAKAAGLSLAKIRQRSCNIVIVDACRSGSTTGECPRRSLSATAMSSPPLWR